MITQQDRHQAAKVYLRIFTYVFTNEEEWPTYILKWVEEGTNEALSTILLKLNILAEEFAALREKYEAKTGN